MNLMVENFLLQMIMEKNSLLEAMTKKIKDLEKELEGMKKSGKKS